MVIKNTTVGKTKGVTIIELGNGDIKVGSLHSKEEKYSGIEFINDVPRRIGTKHNTAGTTTDESNPDAMITFTNIESIEVLERALAKAKIWLRNINGNKENQR